MADDEINDAIATLAQQLRGVIEVAALGGIEHLPRPRFQAPAASPAVASPAVASPAVVRPAVASPAVASPAVAPPAVAQAGLAPPVALAILPPADDVAAALARLVSSSASASERLHALRAEVIGACTRCKLHRGRSQLVFGTGNAAAELVFVGEGPGAEEDRQGVPFVGRAGHLLTRMIEAMGRQRDDVYICTVVKCRPPNDRDPEPEEVEACQPFLQAQLAIVRPRVIVALGRYAAQTLLRTKTPLTQLRGTWQSYDLLGMGIDVMPTYHPSFLLREEADPLQARKREAWTDLQQVMQLLAQQAADAS